MRAGAMSIGEAWTDFMGSMDKEQSFKLLDAFLEAGGNMIDTANNYQVRGFVSTRTEHAADVTHGRSPLFSSSRSAPSRAHSAPFTSCQTAALSTCTSA